MNGGIFQGRKKQHETGAGVLNDVGVEESGHGGIWRKTTNTEPF